MTAMGYLHRTDQVSGRERRNAASWQLPKWRNSPSGIGEYAEGISMRSSTSKPQLRSRRALLVDCLWFWGGT